MSCKNITNNFGVVLNYNLALGAGEPKYFFITIADEGQVDLNSELFLISIGVFALSIV